jgi:gluconate 2-dehydrogenase gamma chain
MVLAVLLGRVLRAERDAGELLILDDTQLATLEAALERLIPSDDGEPGAREAQVIRYVRRALHGVHRGHVDAYRRGLVELDGLALDRFGAVFTALDDERQDDVLRVAEREHAGFFELARSHAIEGMFGDPRWGGNAQLVGWRLLGYPGPRAVVEETDQRLESTA